MKKLLVLALATAIAGAASANSITTLFAGGNGGTSLWTNYFDATAASSLTVTAFDVNVSDAAGTAFSLDVYTRSGTSVGFEANGGAGWTLVSTGGPGSAAGANLASHVTIPSFSIGAGVTGIAIRYIGASPSYTNGNGTNQSFSNSDVSLALGSSASTTAGAFAAGSSVFTPRVWNGTMYYTPAPEPASLTAVGLGIAAILRRRRKA